MIKDSTGSEVVHAVVTLARNLGLRVVAEGIETQAQFEYLRELRCESGQGYYLSSPMSFDELVEMAAERVQKLSSMNGLAIPSLAATTTVH